VIRRPSQRRFSWGFSNSGTPPRIRSRPRNPRSHRTRSRRSRSRRNLGSRHNLRRLGSRRSTAATSTSAAAATAAATAATTGDLHAAVDIFSDSSRLAGFAINPLHSWIQ
jgi:hypothetical protein